MTDYAAGPETAQTSEGPAVPLFPRPIRIRAVAMQLVADLDGRFVELQVMTDGGQTIAIACANDSIFAVQRHIEQMMADCPEIASWRERPI